METPGYILKKERERQQKTLQEIAKNLNLNIEYLRAIESEKYQNIPAEIYTKAYLRFYAHELGLDSAHIITLYQKWANATFAKKPLPAENKPGFPFKTLVLTAFVIVAVLMLLLIVRQRTAPVDPAEEPQKKQSVEVPEPKEEAVSPSAERPEASVIQSQAIPENAPGAQQADMVDRKIQGAAPVHGNNTLSLMITAEDTSWISVGVDGGEPKEWLLRNGERISLTASDRFIIRTGNAGGTRVTFNGKDMGSIGEKGAVADLILP